MLPTSYIPFFDHGVCPWRVPADIALALSFPVLWYRIKTVGLSGVSTETQILHFVTFFLRYACYPTEFTQISSYNTLFKAWYVGASFLTTAYILYARRNSISSKSRREMLFSWTALITGLAGLITLVQLCRGGPTIGTITIGNQGQTTTRILYNYDTPWSQALVYDAPWFMSQLVAVGAMVPQLVLTYKGASSVSADGIASSTGPLALRDTEATSTRVVAGVDVWLWAYVGSIFAFRGLYIVHWIRRYHEQQFLDPLAQACAALQLSIILGFVIAIRFSSNTATLGRKSRGSAEYERDDLLFDEDEEENHGHGMSKKTVLPTIVITDVA